MESADAPTRCGGGQRFGPHNRRLSMKITLRTLIAAVALAGVAFTTPADAMEGPTIVSPQDIKWNPAPAMLPPGVEAAVLLGDPSKEGLFVLRLRFPKGYRVRPPAPPVDEVVTVISGSFGLGMGTGIYADQSRVWPFPAGSFFAIPLGMAHSVFTYEETVVQISAVGPWGLTYINPKDDPRQNTE